MELTADRNEDFEGADEFEFEFMFEFVLEDTGDLIGEGESRLGEPIDNDDDSATGRTGVLNEAELAEEDESSRGERESSSIPPSSSSSAT